MCSVAIATEAAEEAGRSPGAAKGLRGVPLNVRVRSGRAIVHQSIRHGCIIRDAPRIGSTDPGSLPDHMVGHQLVHVDRRRRAGSCDDPFTERLVDGVHAIGARAKSDALRAIHRLMRRPYQFNPRAAAAHAGKKRCAADWDCAETVENSGIYAECELLKEISAPPACASAQLSPRAVAARRKATTALQADHCVASERSAVVAAGGIITPPRSLPRLDRVARAGAGRCAPMRSAGPPSDPVAPRRP